MPASHIRTTIAALLFMAAFTGVGRADTVDIGPRPHFLVQQM